MADDEAAELVLGREELHRVPPVAGMRMVSRCVRRSSTLIASAATAS